MQFTDQPIPTVTDEDVERLALRDFGHAQLSLALSVIHEFGKQPWNRPCPRVYAAILKLANGDIDLLLQKTQVAIEDSRDVLAAAEYPRYTREFGFRNAPEPLRQAIVDDDWRQYREWFDRK
jgi:hypothetical protein